MDAYGEQARKQRMAINLNAKARRQRRKANVFLRWRIEIIFKAWKSHLGLRQLNGRTADLLRLSVMTKLLFCIAVYRLCDALEMMGDTSGHVSLFRLARILGHCAC